MPALYAGIDPSLENTAVCLLSQEGEVVKTFESSQLKLAKNKPYDRLLSLGDWLSRILAENKCTYVGYENYSYGSTNTAYKLGELGGIFKTRLYSSVPGFALLPPSVLKQFATGRGNADKDAMIKQALGESPALASQKKVTSDVCDAYFLAKAALFIHDQKAAVKTGPVLLRHRLEVIKKGNYEQHRRV